MIIAALREADLETRVAITPSSVKQYIKMGFQVLIEHNAGVAAGFEDERYVQAGAEISTKTKIVKQCTVLLAVNEPPIATIKALKAKTMVVAPIDNDPESEWFTTAMEHKITVVSMNSIPRISRAQSMDSLSSQANLAGYRAVLEGIVHFKRAVPMMMTAAGMIHPAKILILGAGVAGLQAIATAKRMGAVVYAFDVRRAAKEQVESLGAEFIEVAEAEDNETKGGYAGVVSEAYQKLQAQLIDEYAQQVDIIVSTALIPGRKAPILIPKNTVELMKPGSVIVDLATSRGGNCVLSIPDKVIDHKEVIIVGYSNMAGFIPNTASELYANNLLQFIKLITPSSEALRLDPQDAIIQQAVLCQDGQYLPYKVTENENA